MAEGFKERYDEYRVGRNGADALSRTCLVVGLVLVVLSFVVVGVNPILYVLVLLLGVAAAVYAAFRMNSSNVGARQAENEAFVSHIPFLSGGREERPSRGEEERPSRRRSQADRPRRRAQASPEPEQREDWDEPEPKQRPVDEKITVTCENCGQRLSVPTGKGNLKITCPRCSNSFTMHT